MNKIVTVKTKDEISRIKEFQKEIKTIKDLLLKKDLEGLKTVAKKHLSKKAQIITLNTLMLIY